LGITIYRAIPKAITAQEKINDLEEQKRHILKRGKIPPGVETGLDSSEYYDSISEEIDKLKSEKEIDEKRPTINAGDWVTINKQYARDHGKRQFGRYRIVQKTVKASEIFTTGDSIHEWGYDPIETKYATKQQISDTDITLKEVRQLFKPKHSGLSKDGNIWVRLKGGYGFQVKSVQSIAEDRRAFEVSRGRMKLDGELIAGKFEDNTIEITKGIGDVWTLAHESEHLAEKAGLISNKEIGVLRRQIKRLVAQGKFKTQNKKDIGGQEDRAVFIEKELQNRASYAGTVQKILQKIADFVDSLVNLFKTTSRGITRAFETGKIFQREVSGREVQTTVPAYAKTAERFYSQVIKTVETKMPAKMQSSAVLPWLKKQPGIKEAELEWMGIEEMLEDK
ncbi:hypothetical protein KA005_32060, partial [bacterium]|nr:hypothetical protein [bacterium]